VALNSIPLTKCCENQSTGSKLKMKAHTDTQAACDLISLRSSLQMESRPEITIFLHIRIPKRAAINCGSI
jgi:hypothetical protein